MNQETGSITLNNTLFGEKTFESTEANTNIDVVEYDSTQDGVEDTIYVDSTNGLMYIWNGTSYQLMSASGSVYYDFEDSNSDGNVVITARSETP